MIGPVTLFEHEGAYYLVCGSRLAPDGVLEPITLTFGREGALAIFLGVQQALIRDMGLSSFRNLHTVVEVPTDAGGKVLRTYLSHDWPTVLDSVRAEYPGANLYADMLKAAIMTSEEVEGR